MTNPDQVNAELSDVFGPYTDDPDEEITKDYSIPDMTDEVEEIP